MESIRYYASVSWDFLGSGIITERVMNGWEPSSLLVVQGSLGMEQICWIGFSGSVDVEPPSRCHFCPSRVGAFNRNSIDSLGYPLPRTQCQCECARKRVGDIITVFIHWVLLTDYFRRNGRSRFGVAWCSIQPHSRVSKYRYDFGCRY
jgi:hypothetical protein